MQALLSAPGGASAARCAAPRRQGCSAALFAAPPQCPPSPACARKLVRARGSCGPLRSAGLTGRASAARRARTAPRASSDVAEGNGAADGASLIAPTPPPPDSLRSPPAPAVQRNSSGGVSLPGTPTGWGAAAAAAAPRSFRKAEMYLVRTDGFTCTRETVKDATLRFGHPSTQQQMLIWKTKPTSVLVLKKLGDDLLPQLMSSLRVLREEGLRCVVERAVYDRLSLEDGFGFVETFLPGDALAEAVDFCVCLGGDGVILHASTLFGSGPAPPIISFNLGSLGFLTAHNMENFQEDIRALMYGDGPMDGVYITLRMRLRCELVRGDGREAPQFYEVLNEVVVNRGNNAFLSKIECYERGRLLTKVQADGIMIATPTGSTAYSVSAGGSMVHPNVPAILFTPVCPHSLSFRPVILPDSAELELRIPSDARDSAWVSFDGKARSELRRGDCVRIAMSEHPLPTINKSDQTHDWFGSLARCLSWNDRIEQRPFTPPTK